MSILLSFILIFYPVLNAAVTVGASSPSDAAKGGGGGAGPLPKAISCGESMASMYYNALGCIHNGMEKHALAALYFRKALDEGTTANCEKQKWKSSNLKEYEFYALCVLAYLYRRVCPSIIKNIS